MRLLNPVRSASSCLVLMAALAGCGPGDPDALIGSCDLRTTQSSIVTGLCLTWTGAQTGDFATVCSNDLDGAYSQTQCPTDALLATCDTDQGGGLYLIYHYYTPGYTIPAGESHCALQGLSSTFEIVP